MRGTIGSGTMSKNKEETSMEKYGNGKIMFEANKPPTGNATAANVCQSKRTARQ